MRRYGLPILILIALPALAQAQSADVRVRLEAESYLRPCLSTAPMDRQECEQTKEEFTRDYLRALAGDYQGQRNVAYLLRGRNDGIARYAVENCAWRVVIMNSQHREAGTLDNANLRTDCGPLTQAERSDADARARQLRVLIRTDRVRNVPARAVLRQHNGPLDGTASPLTADPPAQRR